MYCNSVASMYALAIIAVSGYHVCQHFRNLESTRYLLSINVIY